MVILAALISMLLTSHNLHKQMKQLIFFLFLLIPATAFSQTAAGDSSMLRDKFIRQNIVGEWKDQNSTTVFKKNGSFSSTFDDGNYEHGKWSVEKNILTLRVEILDGYGGYLTVYNILFFSSTKMEFQLIDPETDATIWIAFKTVKKGK